MNDDWAIVVGVRRYPAISDLDGPENDAKNFYAWLIDPAGGKLKPEHVRLILSSDFPDPQDDASANPTHAEVEKAFEWLDDEAVKNGAQDNGRTVGRRLYLYFSGHGYAPSKEEAALLMANARPDRYGNHIAARVWAEWLYEAGYFEEIALFMDCCRNSDSSVGMRQVHIGKVTNNKGLQERQRFYAYATQWDREAREHLDPADNKVHGVFTTLLLSGLSGKAVENKTGLITAASLKSYLYQNLESFLTPEERAENDIGKSPHIADLTNPAQPMVFAQIPLPEIPKVRVTVHVPADAVGKRAEIFGGDDSTPVEAIDQVSPTWEVPLPKGLYELRLASGVTELFKVNAATETQDVRLS
jgi:caspase domain-containing protein